MLSPTVRFIIVIFSSAFFSYKSQQRTKLLSKHGNKDSIFYFLAVTTAVLFVGLRTRYNDTAQYIDSYSFYIPSIKNFLASLFGGKYTIGKNPGFLFICSLMKSLKLNSYWFIMLTSAFSASCYFSFFRKYSGGNFALAIFLFMCNGYANLMAAMKQVLATSIALIALDRYINRKKFSFYFWIFIAITVHPYVFLFLATPFLYGKKPWTNITYIMLFSFLIFGVFSRNTVDIMENVTSLVGDDYSAGYILTGHGVNSLRFFVYLAPVALMFLYKEELFSDSSEIEDLFAQFTILSMSFMFLALFIAAILVGRLPGYFAVPSKIATAWMLSKLSRKGKTIFKPAAVILFFLFFVYEEFINANFNARYASISLLQLLGIVS